MQGVDPAFLSDDDTASKAVDANRWMDLMVDSSAKFGKPIDAPVYWKEKMLEAGFVDVKQEILKVRRGGGEGDDSGASHPRVYYILRQTSSQLPIGAWPKDAKLKEVGRAQSFQELQVLDSYTPGLLSRVHGWTAIEVEVFLALVRKDLKNPDIHLYLPVYFVWGRKP